MGLFIAKLYVNQASKYIPVDYEGDKYILNENKNLVFPNDDILELHYKDNQVYLTYNELDTLRVTVAYCMVNFEITQGDTNKKEIGTIPYKWNDRYMGLIITKCLSA
jgi:hypothetical protein